MSENYCIENCVKSISIDFIILYKKKTPKQNLFQLKILADKKKMIYIT